MKRLFLTLLATALPLFLAACMGAKYRITTNAGETYMASENPQYDVQADTYLFVDENGKEIRLKKQEIRYIKEQ